MMTTLVEKGGGDNSLTRKANGGGWKRVKAGSGRERCDIGFVNCRFLDLFTLSRDLPEGLQVLVELRGRGA